MKNIKYVLPVFVLLMFSCEKSEKLIVDEAQKKSTGLDSEFPYEIYDFGEGEAYLILEDELSVLFDEANSNLTSEITLGVWLAESGLNYKFALLEEMDENEYVLSFEERIQEEETFQFTLQNGELKNSDLKFLLTSVSNQIEIKINEGYNYYLTDVKFIEMDNNLLTLKVRTSLLLNPVLAYSPYTYQVDPATQNKMLVDPALCTGHFQGIHAASLDAERRLMAALPRANYIKNGGFSSNVVTFETGPMAINPIDGSFLPGQTQSLYHPMPAMRTDCLYTSQQDDYNQAISDEIALELNKRIYWDGYAELEVKTSTFSGDYGLWDYDVSLASWRFAPRGYAQNLAF